MLPLCFTKHAIFEIKWKLILKSDLRVVRWKCYYLLEEGICTLTFARNFHCNSQFWWMIYFKFHDDANDVILSKHNFFLLINIFFNLITIESWIDYFFKDNIILDRIQRIAVIIAILPILQEKKFPRINHNVLNVSVKHKTTKPKKYNTHTKYSKMIKWSSDVNVNEISILLKSRRTY